MSDPSTAGGRPSDDERAAGGKFRAIQRGVAPVTTSTATPAPGAQPDPVSRHVDDFFEAIYAIDEADIQGHLSTHLTIVYGDGTAIRIDLDEIGDEPYAQLSATDDLFVVGRGGRTFPRVLNQGTVPDLWEAKQFALGVIDAYNQDWALFVAMVDVALSFVMPPGSAGLPWRIRVSAPRGRPISSKVYDALDRITNRINRRLKRPHIPIVEETLDGAAGTGGAGTGGKGGKVTPPATPKGVKPVVATKGPYAILPDGTEIPPDHFGSIFHGHNGITPDDVVRGRGLPAKTGANDRRLFEHTADGANSAFRGGTPFIQSPDRDAGQGAAYFALQGNNEIGYVYRIEGAPVWELGQHLEGRIQGPGGFRSARAGTQGEVESVFDARVAIEHVKEVWSVREIEGRIRIEKLDWAQIQSTAKPPP